MEAPFHGETQVQLLAQPYHPLLGHDGEVVSAFAKSTDAKQQRETYQRVCSLPDHKVGMQLLTSATTAASPMPELQEEHFSASFCGLSQRPRAQLRGVLQTPLPPATDRSSRAKAVTAGRISRMTSSLRWRGPAPAANAFVQATLKN
mmetsp:Transcript_145343/g.278900  ORF Transcript_145343/g.278900 Transcript_145343/m.278900 type:complete len:147 (+) Transcript_145343:1626-2066(+)